MKADLKLCKWGEKMNAVLELQKLAHDTDGKGQAAKDIVMPTTHLPTRTTGWSVTSNFLCRRW